MIARVTQEGRRAMKFDLLQEQDKFFNLQRGQGKSANTLKNYKTDLLCFNSFLNQARTDMDISDYESTHIMDYNKYLDDRYSSHNSKRRRVQTLRIFFDFLVKQGMMKDNIVRKIPASPKFLDIPRPTPQKDVQTVWQYLLEQRRQDQSLEDLVSLRNQLIFVFIFTGGLKVSDLAKLKEDRIFINEQTPRVMVDHPKKDPYSVLLHPIFVQVFNDYKKVLEVNKIRSGLNFEEILFNANPYKILSGGLSPRGLEVFFEDLRKKLGISNLTPKSLRQSCIFNWLHQGYKDITIKEWMGVGPSYSMKLYRGHMNRNPFSDTFLGTSIHLSTQETTFTQVQSPAMMNQSSSTQEL